MKSKTSKQAKKDWMFDKQQPKRESSAQREHKQKSSKREQIKDGWDSYVPDFVRKSFSSEKEQSEHQNRDDIGDTGRSSWFSDIRLPKEVVKEIAKITLSQADRAKNEIVKIVASEVHGFFGRLNLWEELPKLMDGITVEVEMKIRFRADEENGSVKPEVEIVQKEDSEDSVKQEGTESKEPLKSKDK